MPILFMFLDGVGLAPASPQNPLASAPMPMLRALLGGPLSHEALQRGPALALHALDATLGVPGLPQSGTGQTALFAGVNAAALVGRHQPHVPPVGLRPLLAERSVLRRVATHGMPVAFANPFPPAYWEALATRRLRKSASVIAAEGAGLRLRTLADYVAGQAVAWDVIGEHLHRIDPSAPLHTPADAGATLAGLCRNHALVLYESFLPDLAAHGRLDIPLDEALTRLDGLIGGALAALPADTSLLICSDHGNIEDTTAPSHTRNPVPLLVAGPHAPVFDGLESITGVADAILAALTV